MKLAHVLIVCSAMAAAPAAMAQRWEFGVGAGGGFYNSQNVNLAGTSAAASIQTNVATSAWLDNNSGNHFGGELRFSYQLGDLQLKQGSTTATFGAGAYDIHYDFLWHTASPESRVRPFFAGGAGIKVYRGTGEEAIVQPLSQFALLTKVRDLTPLVSVGVGVKVRLADHVQLRLDVHDYMSSFPKEVITPNVGASVAGWFHDIVPMAGLSFTF